MSVIEKWSKVVVFALEPAFYYLYSDHSVPEKALKQ